MSDWITTQWMNADFGDPRLNARVIEIARAIMRNPGRSIPIQMHLWAATKATYRFLSNPRISRNMLLEGHVASVLQEAARCKEVLFVQQSHELCFRGDWADEPVALGSDCPPASHVHLQTCLAITCDDQHTTVLGLAGQLAWTGEEPTQEISATKLQDPSGALCLLKGIGEVPSQSRWINVSERNADGLHAFLCAALHLGWDVILHLIEDCWVLVDEHRARLFPHLRAMEPLGDYHLELPESLCSHGEHMLVELRVGTVIIPSAQRQGRSVQLNAAHIQGEQLEWVLLTTQSLDCVEDVIRVLRCYGKRRIVDDYHRCLTKTFDIENSRLSTSEANMKLLGLLSVLATRLVADQQEVSSC